MKLISSISKCLSAITHNEYLGKFCIAASAFLSSFFLPVLPVIILCFVAILIDCYYGIKVAYKQKAKIESRLSWHGSISKIKETFIVLVLARAIEYFIFKQTGLYILTCGAALLITLTEVWSILENMNTINPYGPWKAISTFLRKKGNDFLGLDIQALQEGQIKTTAYVGLNNNQEITTKNTEVSKASPISDALNGTSLLNGISIQAK